MLFDICLFLYFRGRQETRKMSKRHTFFIFIIINIDFLVASRFCYINRERKVFWGNIVVYYLYQCSFYVFTHLNSFLPLLSTVRIIGQRQINRISNHYRNRSSKLVQILFVFVVVDIDASLFPLHPEKKRQNTYKIIMRNPR